MAGIAKPLSARLSWVFLRASLRGAMRTIDARVVGLEHLPRSGPAIIASRHYHHFWDGAALLTLAPRPLRIVVTLDWMEHPWGLRLMRGACRAAGWPVVPRTCDVSRLPARGALRAATRECVALLRAGRMLLIFPEAYPTIDPAYTPKTRDDELLPFQPGFLRFAALAERDGRTRVPIIPVGLEYARGERRGLTVRFGGPVHVDRAAAFADQADAIARQVRQLSGIAAESWDEAHQHESR